MRKITLTEDERAEIMSDLCDTKTDALEKIRGAAKVYRLPFPVRVRMPAAVRFTRKQWAQAPACE